MWKQPTRMKRDNCHSCFFEVDGHGLGGRIQSSFATPVGIAPPRGVISHASHLQTIALVTRIQDSVTMWRLGQNLLTAEMLSES